MLSKSFTRKKIWISILLLAKRTIARYCRPFFEGNWMKGRCPLAPGLLLASNSGKASSQAIGFVSSSSGFPMNHFLVRGRISVNPTWHSSTFFYPLSRRFAAAVVVENVERKFELWRKSSRDGQYAVSSSWLPILTVALELVTNFKASWNVDHKMDL
jgi:hypothetical protein